MRGGTPPQTPPVKQPAEFQDSPQSGEWLGVATSGGTITPVKGGDGRDGGEGEGGSAASRPPLPPLTMWEKQERDQK